MKKILIIINFIASGLSLSFGQSITWQEAINQVRDKVVLIEYYEQISSAEKMVAKERVKRNITGLLVNESGLIVTTSSIFKANLEFSSPASIYNPYQIPTEIRVKIDDNEPLPASFIGKDDDHHLAFIKLNTKPEISPIQFKDSHLNLGENVLIIQHLPQRFAYQLTVNERLINAVIKKPQQKYLCENNIKSLSGFGLVLNARGEAVGVSHSLTAPDNNGYEYQELQANEPTEILPSYRFQKLIKNPPVYKQKNTVRKKWLGIYMQAFPRKIARYWRDEKLRGVLINTILEDSPADKAGLEVGDLVLSVNNNEVTAEKDDDLQVFRKLIRGQTDNKVNFKIYRSGKIVELEVLLGETPISQFLADQLSNQVLGFSVKELTQDFIIAKQLDFDTEGVWVSKVERAGWADVAGLFVGDLILKINDHSVGKLQDAKQHFSKIEKEKPQYISLFIKRYGDTRFLFVKTNFL